MTRRRALRLMKRIANKPDWLENAIKVLDSYVKSMQSSFAHNFLDEIITQLEVENGRIVYSNKNKKLLLRLNKVISTIRLTNFNVVIKHMLAHIQHLLTENEVYYGEIVEDKKLVKVSSEKVKEIISNRLGINKDGTLFRDGYMQGLLDAPEVARQLKDYAYRSVATKSGVEGFKRGLKTLIEGEPDKLGVFQKFYRNYAYDTYSHIDALQSKLLAEQFKLKYFIYNGGIIRTSRAFCIRKNGKVFHLDDVQKWELEPDNNAKPPNYDPLIHRGGYGCRHSIDYISEEMAVALRPDLKDQLDYIVKYESKQGGKVEAHPSYDEKDYEVNYKKAKILADNGYNIKIRPVVNAHKVKNPEYEVNGLISDLKVLQKGSKNGFQNGVSDVLKKGGTSVVFDITNLGYSNKELKEALHNTFSKHNRYKSLQEIILIKDNKAVTIAKTEIVNNWKWVEKSRFK